MKIYDLSPEIHGEMAVYKDKAGKKPVLKTTRTMKEGTNESKIDMELHCGSHVDAPFHVSDLGKTIENLELSKFFGDAVVLDFTKAPGSIKKSSLILHKSKIKKNDIVLLKTKARPEEKFNCDFVYLEKTGAQYLASLKIKAVGIDSLGIERNQPNHKTHNILLSKNIPIFEGLDLSKVREGRYTFYGFPLRIRKGDASPVRAVLVK